MRSTNRTLNRWRVPRICALNCALALASAGCMTSPQNNQQLQSTDEDVTFNGFVPTKESVVQVSAKHDNGGYDPIILGAPVSPEEHVDAANQKWFSWSAVSEITGKNYWRQVPGQRRLSATVKSESWPGWSEWAQAFPSTPLASFDTGFGDCLNQNAPYGGGAIIANCHSAQSPEVTVTAPCGQWGHTCCDDGTPCDGSMFCYPRTNVCALCGSENSQCCSEEICAGGLQCQADNYCRPGGVTWELSVRDLYTLDIQDDNGDEPYFLVLGFRSTPGQDGSTDVFWNNQTGVIRSAVPAGFSLQIPANQGRIQFPNVRTTRASNIGSQTPEILGTFVIAMENDGSDPQEVRRIVESARPTLKQILVETIEDRSLQDIVQNGVDLDEDAIVARFDVSTMDVIQFWIDSKADPDDPIGFHVLAYVAVDDSIPVPASNNSLFTLERLRPLGTGLPGGADDVTLTGIVNASYSVNRFATKL